MQHPVYNIFIARKREGNNTNRRVQLFFQGMKTEILNDFVIFIMIAQSISYHTVEFNTHFSILLDNLCS